MGDPTPVPSWLQPLRLDHALISAAVDACREVADLLGVVTEERAAHLRAANTEWRGPHQATSTAIAAALDADAVTLAASLRHLAGAMEANRVEVQRQNLVRAEGRQRWLAEQGEG